MPTKANGAIGSLDLPDLERRRLAKKSQIWKCEKCGLIKDLLVHPRQNITSSTSSDNSDKIHTASTSNPTQMSVIQRYGGLEDGPPTTHINISVNGTRNTKDEENNLNCSKSSSDYQINSTNQHSDSTDPHVNPSSSTQVTNTTNNEGNARQNRDESNLIRADREQHNQTRSDKTQEPTNSQIISQSTSNQRSYSMVIFCMAVVIILLILRRLFFVVL